MNDGLLGLLILGIVIAALLFGGATGAHHNGLVSGEARTPEQKYVTIQEGVNDAQSQVEDLQKKIQVEEDKKLNSVYKGKVSLLYVSHANDPSQEYVAIRDSSYDSESIPVTGWTLKESPTNTTVQIPKGAYLFYTSTINSEQNIYLNSGDYLYVVSGISPVGVGFKSNKCSGYLSQFQTFIPYITSSCPAPRNEDLSSIPNTPVNDTCFDYIDSMPSCRIQTDNLPPSFSYECNNFIYTKINYPSCVDRHKNDRDFYGNEWRVYLKHTGSVWRDRRETLTLYDNLGKIVDSISY